MLKDTVFHYTSASAFEKILTSRELWATNFSFLDDPTEVTYGLSIVETSLRKERRRVTSSVVKAFWQDTAARMKQVAVTEFYVACFSGLEDEITQWRAFGAGPVRYAIGFRFAELKAIAKQRRAQFVGVLYDKEVQHDRVQQLMRATSRFVGSQPLKKRQRELVSTAIARKLVNLLVRFKSPKFRSEDEWRIVIEMPSQSSTKVKFDCSRGVLRPYIPVRLAPQHRAFPLSSVWVLAPGRGSTAIKAASLVLSVAGITSIVPNESHVPFAV